MVLTEHRFSRSLRRRLACGYEQERADEGWDEAGGRRENRYAAFEPGDTEVAMFLVFLCSRRYTKGIYGDDRTLVLSTAMAAYLLGTR